MLAIASLNGTRLEQMGLQGSKRGGEKNGSSFAPTLRQRHFAPGRNFSVCSEHSGSRAWGQGHFLHSLQMTACGLFKAFSSFLSICQTSVQLFGSSLTPLRCGNLGCSAFYFSQFTEIGSVKVVPALVWQTVTNFTKQAKLFSERFSKTLIRLIPIIFAHLLSDLGVTLSIHCAPLH